MPQPSSTVRKKLCVLLIIVSVAAGVAWWQRTPLLGWFYLRGLSQADDNNRATWVARVVGLDADVTSELIDMLRQNDARTCVNSEAALAAFTTRWGAADARTAALAEQLDHNFPSLSVPGREAALEWFLSLVHQLGEKEVLSPQVSTSLEKLLTLAAKMPDKGVHARTLALAEVMLGKGLVQNVDLCRDMATTDLGSKDADICNAAIRLLIHAPLNSEKALLDQVVPLLTNTSPEVRRSAVLALGLAEESITIQEMLPLFQDPDAKVRELCEWALRGRGLQPNHIKIAQSISDSRPHKRLDVFKLLDHVEDLDPGQWLVHLSQDPSPAVRAAAIRFAAADPAAKEFQSRMQQMMREDPSPTVRQLAEHYWKVYQR